MVTTTQKEWRQGGLQEENNDNLSRKGGKVRKCGVRKVGENGLIRGPRRELTGFQPLENQLGAA